MYRRKYSEISTLVGGEWSASRPGRFISGERALGTHWIGGWVGLKTVLEDVERRKILPLAAIELRLLGRPTRNQTLYKLTGSHEVWLAQGRAVAQAVRRWLPTAAARFRTWGFVVDKAALGQVFSEYFDFPCQSSFHQCLHNHNQPGLAQ
jgi:hypothetical protein